MQSFWLTVVYFQAPAIHFIKITNIQKFTAENVGLMQNFSKPRSLQTTHFALRPSRIWSFY